MKKNIVLIILSIIVSILLTSCLTKIDLEKKGSLNLTIKWPKVSVENKSINKAIKAGTTTIIVTIHQQGKSETTQTRTITHSNEIYHSVEFTNLVEGKWHLSIVGKDSSGTEISSYGDLLDITADAPTIVQTMFGAPNKIMLPSSMYGIQNEGIMDYQYGQLAVDNPGNSYNDSSITNSAIFFVSENMDFSTNVSGSPFEVNPMQSYPQTPTMVNIGISDANIIIENNKTYYWKVMVINDYGYRESNVFSFNTQIIP